MEIFKDFDLKKPLNMFKIAVAGLLGMTVVVFLYTLIISSVRPGPIAYTGNESTLVAPGYYSGAEEVGGSGGINTEQMKFAADLSYRNIAPLPSQGTTGNTAEQFEVTDYNATIETRDKNEACARIADLKSLSYIIFEYAQDSDKTCHYTFKVEQAKVGEVLGIVNGLDPKQLYENTRTIKNEVDDFTSQTEILEKKLVSIDETLKNALSAYDQITALAVKTQDASSLAKIIDSKVQLIERMTQERIAISQQLDYLAKAKSEQLDRLNYTYFTVNVYENKYIDGQDIKDSWKIAVKNFFYNINFALQNATVGLVAMLVMVIPYVVYAVLIVLTAKYGWRWLKKIWYK